MRPETILHALEETSPEYLAQAAEPRQTARRCRPLTRIALIAAVVILLMGTVYAGASALTTKVPATEIHNPGGFDVHFSRKAARRALPDGWVFTFVQNLNKEDDDRNLIRYQFFGVNLRYRYDDDYAYVTLHSGEDPNPITVRCEEYLQDPSRWAGSEYRDRVLCVPSILSWGGGSEAQRRDMEQIDALLEENPEPEALLALDPADYTFESFDKEIFFDLMHEALTGEPQEEATDLSYWNHASVALLTEPEWQDGYRFQAGFLNESGCVDELYIDLLYQTGEGYRDYVQLSDLVESGEASPEQREAFELIRAVTERIKTEERFLAGAELYRDKTLAGVDFNRLLQFMTDIHELKYTQSSAYNEYVPETNIG